MTGKIAASGNVNSLLEEDEDTARTMSLADKDYCYFYMFRGCKSLTKAPELPATTLAASCYRSMFSICTSLTQAPELPATTLAASCYSNMFSGCTSLNYIKVGFTNWTPTNATNGWLPDNSGTFECPQTLIDNTTTRDGSTVPASWTMVAV